MSHSSSSCLLRGLLAAMLGLVFVASPVRVAAQVPKEPATVVSPNVAALQATHSAAVSPFTGAPNFTVPLYTVQDGAVSLPITLRYASAGFRPDDHPGWVGMGWNLDVGGTITRTVNDLPDELTMGGGAQPMPGSYGPYLWHNGQNGAYPDAPFNHAGLFWGGTPAYQRIFGSNGSGGGNVNDLIEILSENDVVCADPGAVPNNAN